jgi:hypothetical protein
MAKHAAFLAKKGFGMRGDEPSDAFSDDTGPLDSKQQKRERKEAVQLFQAEARHIVSKAAGDPHLKTGRFAGAAPPDSEGKAAVKFVDVHSADVTTYQRARRIDPAHETELQQGRVAVQDTRYQTTTEVDGHRVLFNWRKLWEDNEDSALWRRDALVVVIIVGLSGSIMFYVYTSLRAYLHW